MNTTQLFLGTVSEMIHAVKACQCQGSSTKNFLSMMRTTALPVSMPMLQGANAACANAAGVSAAGADATGTDGLLLRDEP